MTERIESTLKQWRAALQNRSLWHQHWEDLARVELVRRLGFVTQTIEGDRRTEDLYDGTAIREARSLANVMGGMIRPEGEPWHFIKTVEDADGTTDEAKDWLSDTDERMRDALNDPRARFRQATGEADLDLVVLGTAPMFIGEVVGQSRLLFQSVHLKDGVPVYGEDGNLEGMFRSRRLTVRQIDKRGWRDKVSVETRHKFEDESKLEEKIEFLFSVLPRPGGRKDAAFARNMPFSNVVIEVQAKHEVEVGGFPEMPYIAPRWDTTSGEDYGRSPGMIALPDANTSQAVGETMLVAGQRAADPSLLVPSDAFIDAPNTFPGGLGYYEADAVQDLGFDPFKVLEPGRNFPLTREIQGDIREQISQAFMRNLFNLPVEGPQMTATEVIKRSEEFIREIGPVFGRIESDYTGPMVERAFRVMLRAGAFLPIPDVLSGRSVTFEYESPVKRIRELALALAARDWAREQAEFEAVRPGAFDIVNTDALGRFNAQARRIPNFLVNSEDTVGQIREQRAAEQEAQRSAELAAGAADAGSKLLNALPEDTVTEAIEGI